MLGQTDLYALGTKAVVKKKVNQEHGGLEVILLGIERSVIIKLEQADAYLQGRVKPLPLPEQKTAEVEALHRELLEMAGSALGMTEPVRVNTAMTGEITLTGLVLPVGGIKKKVLAAHRAHIQRVILPKDNERDLREIPETVRQEIQIIFAERIEDVLVAAIPELNELLAVARAS